MYSGRVTAGNSTTSGSGKIGIIDGRLAEVAGAGGADCAQAGPAAHISAIKHAARALLLEERIARPRDSADLHAEPIGILDVEADVVRRVDGAAPREPRLEAPPLQLGPHPVRVPVLNLPGDVIDPRAPRRRRR